MEDSGVRSIIKAMIQIKKYIYYKASLLEEKSVVMW